MYRAKSEYTKSILTSSSRAHGQWLNSAAGLEKLTTKDTKEHEGLRIVRPSFVDLCGQRLAVRDGSGSPWPLVEFDDSPIEEGIRETASYLFVLALFPALPGRGPSSIQQRKIQSTGPQFSFHVQLRGEGHSGRREACTRLGSGATDGPASDCARSRAESSRQNAHDAGNRIWQSDDVCRDPESGRGQSGVQSRVQSHASRILTWQLQATRAHRSG